MNTALKIFRKTELIFILAIAIPLLIAFNVSSIKFMINILLGIVMFFSIRPFFNTQFNLKKRYKGVIFAVIINYVILSGVYLVLASIFFDKSSDLFIGYILMAIVPGAVSIVPLCFLTKCEDQTADFSIVVSFLLSLIIIPAALYMIFGKTIDFTTLIEIMFVLVIIPMGLAYMLRKSDSGIINQIFNHNKEIINICLGLVIFVAISVNRGIFLQFTRQLSYVYAVNILAIAGTGLLVFYLTSKFFEKREAITYALYASQKNVGTSISIGLFLFNPVTAIPAIIALVLQFIFFLFFEKVFVSKTE